MKKVINSIFFTVLLMASFTVNAGENQAQSSCLTQDIAQSTGAGVGGAMAGGAVYGGGVVACAAATGGVCLAVVAVATGIAAVAGAIFGSEAGKIAGKPFCD